MTNVSNSSIQNIEETVGRMEKSLLYPTNYPAQSIEIDMQVMRARRAVVESKCYSAVFKWVPEDYYSYPLSKRQQSLNAESTYQLCKSMLMENKAFDPNLQSSKDDHTYSQFYLILVQYEAAINNKKLCSEVRGLRELANRLDPSKFDFRVASEEDNARLTGFSHNAVTPFGMKANVPIILSKGIVNCRDMPQFIWMGGGHVHCKIGVSVHDFISSMSPFVLDISDPRENNNDEF